MNENMLTKKVDKLERAVEKLRRELDIFVPKESISEYENADEIEAGYQEALTQYPPYESQDN